MVLSIHAAAADCPDGIAIIADDVALSYRELAMRVTMAGAAIEARGLSAKSGALVAIAARNRVETLITLLALIDHKIPFVPLHPRWTEHEVQRVLSDARPACVLRDDDVDALCTARFPVEHSPERGADDAAAALAILYTSGTSGVAKGAQLSRAAFVASAAGSAQLLGWQARDRWLLCLPLCHIGGLSIVTRCVLARRPIVLVPRFDADAVLAAITRHQATLISVVPTMLHGLLEADRGGALRGLRALISGGAATPFSLLERAVASGVNVLTTYGLTEACSQVTLQPWQLPPRAQRGSGVPLPGVELTLRDDDGNLLPKAATGRICLRGPTVMSGYLHREPLGDRYFDTGDLGELDETGALHVHARRQDLIVTGGENVYPAEVEQALVEVPGIARALVFGVPEPVWGAEVAAALVIEAGGDAASIASGLAAALQERLAPFKRPRLLAILNELPELGSGKPDRRAAVALASPVLRRVPR